MIAATSFISRLNVRLPAVVARTATKHCEVWAELQSETEGLAECIILQERAGVVQRARLQTSVGHIDVCFTKKHLAAIAQLEIHAPDAFVTGDILHLGASASWKNHPLLAEVLSGDRARHVRESWFGYPVLKQVQTDTGGNTVASGLRVPQVGALHAIAAHWSVKNTHAKIVLPTGTGKTDVMIGATLLKGAERVLVLVPSDALRTQILGNFSRLGILRNVGAVSDLVLNPVVAKILKAPSALDQIIDLRRANVVASTTHMLLGMSDSLLEEFLRWFDLVLFDEAHHLPAASWRRIHSKLARDKSAISVTATPYRNDGKRVPGELIYQFPLRLAQQQGYFRQISVVRVEEYDEIRADAAIARRAVQVLREDEQAGFRHVIFARAKSVEHAESLRRLYEGIAPELNPLAIHSSLSGSARRSALSELESLQCRVAICVDMLGEGFDLPSLKIAALHEVHKSLPVTLQFIGRFTRSSAQVGQATAVINMATPVAESAVAELFSDDADWNELVPELSAQAIQSEQDIAAFLGSMQSGEEPEDRKFDLALVRPKTSAVIYRATQFNPARLQVGLEKGSVVHQSWTSDDRNLLVFITQDRVFPEWSFSKEASSLEWNLGVVAYDEERQLLYLNSTYGQSRTARIARALAGESAALLAGERVFRVFEGIHRAVLHNVGLYRRGGGLRFQMMAGMDIGEYVTTAIQAGSSKSNLFVLGYEDGRRVNVGASAKGRVWAMTPKSIPDWLEWVKSVARKISDDSIQTNSFLRFVLVPTEVTGRPNVDVFTCVPPEELLPGDQFGTKRISVGGGTTLYTQLDLSFNVESVEDDCVSLELRIADAVTVVELRWTSRGFQVRHRGGSQMFVHEGGNSAPIHEFLKEFPPVLLLVDGSELVGNQHYRWPEAHPYTFHPSSILGLGWGDVPITLESKWKNGRVRAASVQGFMIEKCLEREASFVFDDDDPGEMADIIVLEDKKEDRELEVSLYHCKYSGGEEPSARYKDLYEVCGQAVKSARVMNRAESLLAHMISREGRLRGRQTRFERGTLEELRSLSRRIHRYRMRLNIYVVQPGLSASALTPALSSILGAADGFVLEFTGRRLKVIGSS